MPIGMFGFLAALLAIGVAVAARPYRPRRTDGVPPAPSADLPNGAMVERFDSYLYRVRARPSGACPGRDRRDQRRSCRRCKQTLERVDTLDPAAQDARRLMSIHLPGLIDRYDHVPAAYRQERMAKARPSINGWSKGSPQAAPRCRGSERLARADVAALETQGRFIQSRYGEHGSSLSTPTRRLSH